MRVQEEQAGPRLVLDIVDQSTGEPIAARFSLEVDGELFTPSWVDENGISFTSIHESKKQRYTALYSKGRGPVSVALPDNAKKVVVWVARGFQYLMGQGSANIRNERVDLSIELSRWTNLEEAGWIAVDEHLHYDRLDPKDDGLWLSMLEADGLTSAHFMVLKGGMVPGIWSRQFAYGPEGQGSDGQRLLVPGQEYRDTAQGHINLLGIDRVILPYSTGGSGSPTVFENYPTLHDVLLQARSYHAMAGVAHGGTLGRHSTSLADAVLGAVDFWEISNGFIYNTENWYRLMNCGIFLPMAAGTDLPNWPFRDPWQPMLGSIRMYVNTGGNPDFESFRSAVAQGKVFISGGPLIELTVNDKGVGETIRLPKEGGLVRVRAVLSAPHELKHFQLVKNGSSLTIGSINKSEGRINRWVIEREVHFDNSGWLTAWGKGPKIVTQKIDAMAHSGVIKILVGQQAIESSEDAKTLIELFQKRASWYQSDGVYESEAQRKVATAQLDKAIQELKKQIHD